MLYVGKLKLHRLADGFPITGIKTHPLFSESVTLV